jgi:hypothetical protein
MGTMPIISFGARSVLSFPYLLFCPNLVRKHFAIAGIRCPPAPKGCPKLPKVIFGLLGAVVNPGAFLAPNPFKIRKIEY